MKTVRTVGFFRELKYGNPHGGSLKAAAGHLRESNLNDILSYLKAGKAFVVSPGLTRDELSGNNDIIGGSAVLTDGFWAWHSDLAYYVGKYSVELPREFIDHMRSCDWRIGPVNVGEIQLPAFDTSDRSAIQEIASLDQDSGKPGPNNEGKCGTDNE